MTKKLLCMIMLCACLLLAGCAPKGPTVATITLPGNPTTGFEWNFQISDDTVLKQTHTEYIPDAGEDTDVAGSGGQYRWTFAAVKPGEVSLTFAYAQSFENLEPASLVTYTFEVDEKGVLSALDATGTLSPVPEAVLSEA